MAENRISKQGIKEDEKGIPAYSAFAIPFIENRIDKWQQKDSYETLDEYRARMTEKNRVL